MYMGSMLVCMKTRAGVLYLLQLLGIAGQFNIDVAAIDDNDSSILYAGNWSSVVFDDPFGSSNAPTSLAHDGTVHLTQHSAANATFSFVGTSVLVYGLSNPGGDLLMSFIIDDGDAMAQNNVTLPQDGLPVPCLWFRTDNLSDGNHTLLMKMNTVPVGTNDAYFILDYIVYGRTSLTSLTPPQSSQPGSTTSSTNTVGSQSPSGSIISTQSSPPNTSHAPVDAIVGAVLGVLLVVVALLFVWYWRRVRQMNRPPPQVTRQSNPFPYSLPIPVGITEGTFRKASGFTSTRSDRVEESEITRLQRRINQLEREMAQVQASSPDVERRDTHVEQRHDQLLVLPPPYNRSDISQDF